MKKLKLLLIIMSCVLLTGAIFPGKLAADCVTEEWAARYNGPGNLTDTASAMAVDSSGNVYVTGSSYDSGTEYDYATVKYDSDGNEVWAARYDGPASPNDDDYPEAIAVDSSGNVYVTGYSTGSGTRDDYATIKYAPDGTELWVARYNGPLANSLDYAYAIAVDSLGNVYVTGQSHDIGTGDDYATIKYDPNGNELWVARYDGPAHSVDAAQAIALDSSGNVYVTGDSYGSGTWDRSDYATIKYTPDSNIPVWVARYHANSFDYANAIAVDTSGNVYVTGDSAGSGTNKDYATIKYDPNGTEEWVARYNGPSNDVDVAEAIAVDSSGNVYVTGYSDSNSIGTNFDYATIKYTPDSNIPVWVARYNGPANSSDSARAIALDSLGNVYVTGSSGGIGTNFDYATIKYTPDSNIPVWVERYNAANYTDHAWAIAVDSSGNVYVTGDSDSSGTPSSRDYATIKYSQVENPAEDIEDLIDTVISLNVKQGILNSLDAKLDAALKAIDDINTNNDVAAINTLEAFINAVQAQSGNQITEADADTLIAAANNIIVTLQNGCD